MMCPLGTESAFNELVDHRLEIGLVRARMEEVWLRLTLAGERPSAARSIFSQVLVVKDLCLAFLIVWFVE